MLSFQEEILEDFQKGGLCILGVGLGTFKVISGLLNRCHGKLTILLNFTENQRKCLHSEIANSTYPFSFTEVTSEYTSSDRASLYSSNEILYITSRILVVDILSNRVPLKKISGIIVHNAHKITESCTESFILRLFRAENTEGTVWAFSDRPTAFTQGFSKVDRVLKYLFLAKLSLWPRFQVSVSSTLESFPAEVEEIRVPVSPKMRGIQEALVQILDMCLKELQKTQLADVADLTVENGLFRSLEENLRRQLDPLWPSLPRKTKQLVSDLRTLRQLAEALPRDDCVSFLYLLEALRASESRHSLWLFAEPCQTLFSLARLRVHRVISQAPLKKDQEPSSFNQKVPGVTSRVVVLEPILEELPKWKILRELLEEIMKENPEGLTRGSVLVVSRGDEGFRQLRDVLERGSQAVLMELWERYISGKPEYSRANEKSPPGRESAVPNAEVASTSAEVQMPAGKRQKRAKRKSNEKGENGDPRNVVPESVPEIIPESVPSNSGTASVPSANPLPPGVVQFQALEDGFLGPLLGSLKPRYIIMSVPDLEAVREVEVYQATEAISRVGFRAKVFCLLYQESTEERKFEATLGREQRAFQTLIRQKSTLPLRNDAFPLQFPPSSPQAPSIIVDTREFSSQLPCVLHQSGFRILPLTLAVGDYVLSPLVGVERKSPQDLVMSLNSGRLYTQAAELTKNYGTAILLLEFQGDRRFCLQSAADLSDDISGGSVLSRLCLLALHFPRLKIVWSRSLHATAQIFKDLKANQDEPAIQQALKVGTTSLDQEEEENEEAFNTSAVDFLQKLPGVNSSNYRSLMDNFESLAEVASAPFEKLVSVMGGRKAAKTLREFLDAKCPSISTT